MDLTIPPLSEPAMAAAFEHLERNKFGRLEGLAVWLAGVQDAMPPRPLRRRRTIVVAEGTYDDGLALADKEADEGADVVVAVSPTTAGTAAMVALLTNAEPVEVVPNGPAWAAQVAAVRDAMRRHKGTEPIDLPEQLGVPALVGFLVGCAKRRTPVVLDGPATAAAALVARTVSPLVLAYLAAGHVTPHPAHRRALDTLALTPLLDLGVRADGGGALALPLLDAALELFDERG